MKILRNLSKHYELNTGAVVAIGNFDGVHLGHKFLLNELKLQSINKHLPMVVIIFEPQAREFFSPGSSPPRIYPLRDKLKFLSECGVDYVLCLRFNRRLASMEPREFAIKVIFENLNAKYLLVGSDFKFGKERQGNFELLTRLGVKYDCEVASCVDFILDNQRISSTAIRGYLTNSEFFKANHLLGRTYSISGRVIRGDGNARKWGVPTANLRISQLPLVLKGVYCVQIKSKTGIILSGVANIGHRPTVAGKRQVLEVHIFNFSDSLYGELLEVLFLNKLRDEIKFSSIDELVSRIKQDVALAKEYFLG